MSGVGVSQMVLYENEAILVSYANGSGLELAPCASTFIYHHARRDQQHPLHGTEVIQQRCEFVTSSFKPSVLQAIEFRNKYATRPYLCRELLQSSVVQKLHADVCDVAWPTKLRHARYNIHDDGAVTLRSECGSAALILDASQQRFTVEFVCHTSRHRRSGAAPAPVKHHTELATESRGDNIPKFVQSSVRSKHRDSADDVINSGESWEYATVEHNHSVQECPDLWNHALNIALEAAQTQRAVTFTPNSHDDSPELSQNVSQSESLKQAPIESGARAETSLICLEKLSNRNPCDTNEIAAGNNGGVRTMQCVYSTVPQALWLNCASPHLHKWCANDLWNDEDKFAESAAVNGRIKVMCLRGIIYRFLWAHPRTIEIYPGDGTTLRSSGLSGHFFNHYYNHCGKIEEKMYSIDRPPPDIPGAKYSIARLILTAARFLRHLYEDGVCDAVNCCWKEEASVRQIKPALSTVLLEECVVPGVGRFTAYSSGRVRVMYCDRTALDVWADFSKRLGHCKQHSQDGAHLMPDIHSYQPKSSKSRCVISELPQGVAKLMLPNGHYQHVILSQPAQYYKYIQAAKEWVSWVNSSPDERYQFYENTLHDPHKTAEIDKELKKINCFNYIIENTVLSDFQSAEGGPQVGHTTASSLQDTNLHQVGHTTASSLQDTNLHAAHTKTTGQGHDRSLTNQISDFLSRTDNLTAQIGMSLNEAASYFPANQRVERSTGVDASGDMSHMDFSLVQEALRKTSQTVTDLDSYLSDNAQNTTY